MPDLACPLPDTGGIQRGISHSSFRRKPESSLFKQLQTIWTPVFTGVTIFYEIVNLELKKMSTKYSSDFKNGASGSLEPGEEKTPTWLDSKTGLEWQYECAGEMSWSEAIEYAKSLSLNGKDDWRLPTAMELETLLHRDALYDRLRPVMRKNVPFRDKLSYWSSTTFGKNTNSAWIVMFDGAYVLSYYKSNHYYVRCVRG